MMIHTEDLTKRFGDILAVDRLTLSVDAGEVFGFLGPNGAGKTTTIRLLTALIAPTSGHAKVAGCKVGREDGKIRRQVGILTESPGLYDRMLGLWERRHEEAGTFSKGMRQKLAIARALLHEPQVLFLDEPTSGLDPEMARLVREFIGGLKREGRTIFICTHNLDEADRLCDRIAIINTRLLALDTPSALRRQLYERTVVFHLRQAEPRFTRVVEALSYVRSVRVMDNKLVVALDDPEKHNPTIIRTLVESGADVQFVGELRRTLEDVYLRLVGMEDGKNNISDQGSGIRD
jgi:ABC-2 type transport system ATP-binding protein